MVSIQNSFKFNLIQSNLILGAAGEYQTLLQQVTLPYVDHDKCETLLRATRLGERFGLGESFNCAGGKFQSIFTMAIRVVKFSNGGLKERFFANESTYHTVILDYFNIKE